MNIRLEPYELRHAEVLHAAAIESIEDLAPYMPWCHPNYSIREAREFVSPQPAYFAAGTAYEFTVVSDDGKFLGACGLNGVDKAYRRANLGYWIRSSATGQGVATAAVRKLVEWAWAHTDLNRLEIVIAVDNARSMRVAEKADAYFEGIAKSRLFLHGKFHDARIYSLVRSAPEGNRP